jgi:hypothetical protein
MRQPIVGAIGLLIVLFTALPVSAEGVRVKEARFPTSFEAGGISYTLIGHGLFEYMIWDAYAGAYYQAADILQPSPQAAVPRHLELEYFHPIEAGDFAEATRDKIRENLDNASYNSLIPALRDFNEQYRDVEPGDRYALRWDGDQLSLALNDQTLYRGEDPALANALFGIWLGEAPLNERFRDALLGR